MSSFPISILCFYIRISSHFEVDLNKPFVPTEAYYLEMYTNCFAAEFAKKQAENLFISCLLVLLNNKHTADPLLEGFDYKVPPREGGEFFLLCSVLQTMEMFGKQGFENKQHASVCFRGSWDNDR